MLRHRHLSEVYWRYKIIKDQKMKTEYLTLPSARGCDMIMKDCLILLQCFNSVLVDKCNWNHKQGRIMILFSNDENVKYFHTSVTFNNLEDKSTSKLKEKKKAVEELAKVSSGSKSEPKGTPKKTILDGIISSIPSLVQESKLLRTNVMVSSSLGWKAVRGETLTARELSLLTKTVANIFRALPFSVYIIGAGVLVVTPFVIKYIYKFFPRKSSRRPENEALNQSLKTRLDASKFFYNTLEEVAVTSESTKSNTAKEFVELINKIRSDRKATSREDILKCSKHLENRLILDSLSKLELTNMCEMLQVESGGTISQLIFQLQVKLKSLAADDLKIKTEGVNKLTESDLLKTSLARGMLTHGMSSEHLRDRLNEWLKLTVDDKIPSSLILISRVFTIPDIKQGTIVEKLAITISALPEALVVKAKAAIGEREGKVGTSTTIELIKHEAAKIEEENQEIKEAENQKTQRLAIPRLPIPSEDSKNQHKPEEQELHAQEIMHTLGALMETASKTRKSAQIKSEVNELAGKMNSFQNDLNSIMKITSEVKKVDKDLVLTESLAAKRLSWLLSNTITSMDNDIEKLEEIENLEKDDAKVSIDSQLKREHLTDAIHELKNTPQTEMIKKIIEKFDINKDGNVSIKVINRFKDLVGRENVTLNSKQIDELLDLIKKEEGVDK